MHIRGGLLFGARVGTQVESVAVAACKSLIPFHLVVDRGSRFVVVCLTQAPARHVGQ